jgi:hypothetical protein
MPQKSGELSVELAVELQVEKRGDQWYVTLTQLSGFTHTNFFWAFKYPASSGVQSCEQLQSTQCTVFDSMQHMLFTFNS